MSLSKLFAGRKRNSSVWKWFKYDASSDKSVCLVLLDGEKVCNTKLCGKNPTNLKVSLSVRGYVFILKQTTHFYHFRVIIQ